MTVRRLLSVLCVGLAASASVVAAQPKKKDAPKAPAPATPPAGSGSGSGSGEGSAVEMKEDPPPSDMNGTDENPDAPKTVGDPDQTQVRVVVPPPEKGKAGYPIEEVARPITLPRNMSEVSIDPHVQVDEFTGTSALHARYGITRQVQLGLTYVLGGVFKDPNAMSPSQGFHPGKAVGLDVTVLLQDWIAVRVGAPFYISPFAASLAIGAPIKFNFGDKLALGGFDDLLNIKLNKFAPSFYQELQNQSNAFLLGKGTVMSAGELRVSLFGEYQYEADLAIIGRIGVNMEDFATGKTSGCNGECLTTFIHAGVQYTPKKYLDLGASIGFDDLAHGGSFAPSGFLAFRI